MLLRKAYKFKLKPTQLQAQRLRQLAGCARFVWNYGLAETKRILAAGEKLPSAFDLHKMLTGWKKQPEMAFLTEAYTTNLQQKLHDLNLAWRRCFDKKLAAKAPVFKRKMDGRDSIRIAPFDKYCLLEKSRVKLPAKLGWVKFRQSQQVMGKIKNITISQSASNWFISLQVEQEIEQPVHSSRSMIGVDVGIAKLATLSDATVHHSINSFKTKQINLARYQRRMSRKIKFSQNWKRAKQKVQKIHAGIANIRRDYLHKVTTTISKNHAMIAVEALKVSNMSKSAGGTLSQPGRNVRAKSGLNRAILDQGWYEFRRQLNYKQLWRGGGVIAVSPRYTSQKCPSEGCGHIAQENRTSQAKFQCVACGYANNADVVGALNILYAGYGLLASKGDVPYFLAAGHAGLACGGTVQSGRPMKQEPDAERSVVTQ